MRRMTMSLVSVAAVLALAACGDDSGVTTSDGTDASSTTTEVTVPDTVDTGDGDATTTVPVTTVATTPAPTEAPTTVPETTVPETTVPPTDAPTTTTEPDGSDTACGTLDPVIDSARVTSSTGVDWDGDGSQESTATVYETDTGNGDYRLRVEGDAGGSEVALITDGLVEPWVLGTVQVDFSLGSDQPQPQELLVSVGANSSGFNVGVFFQDDTGCLNRFTTADESPLELPIHASIGTASGLYCDGAAGSQFIVRTTATASAGSGEYDVHDIRMGRDGNALVDDVDIPGLIVDDGTPDSPFLRYSSIANCGVVFPDA